MLQRVNFVLAYLFPPRLPGRIRDWEARVENFFDEQGVAGNVQPRPYRDGIDRYFAQHQEESQKTYRTHLVQYFAQLRAAEIAMAAEEQHLLDQGYVNTIHDCWEPNEQ